MVENELVMQQVFTVNSQLPVRRNPDALLTPSIERRVTAGWRFYAFLAGLSAIQFSSFVSMFELSAFFLEVCERKGVSGIQRGAIIGMVECVFIVMSYFFLGLAHKIPLKYQICTGQCIAGVSVLAFAFTEYIENSVVFVAVCLVLRGIQGTAIAVSDVCVLIAGNKASPPEKLATLIGYLELFVSLALAVSPPLGGWLYEVGGYRLPFLVSAGMLILAGLSVLPTVPGQVDVAKKHVSEMVFDTLKIKFFCVQLLIAGAFLGFFSGMIEPHLREYHLTPSMVGLVILVTNAFSAFAFPIWGYICDALLKPSTVTLIACLIGAVGFILFGPFPGLPVSNALWIRIVSLAFCGVSLSGLLISTYAQARTRLGAICRSDENADTVVSAAYIATANFGSFLGTLLGGVFIDYLGYVNGSAVLFGLQMSAFFIQLIIMWMRRNDATK